jgi:hypothetical protein
VAVSGQVHLAHTARAEAPNDRVRTHLSSDVKHPSLPPTIAGPTVKQVSCGGVKGGERRVTASTGLWRKSFCDTKDVTTTTRSPAMTLASPRRLLFLGLLALALRVSPASASDTEEAKAYADKATAAFALSHFPAAAEYFEKAFQLRPDPALLYNAAQAHRLAGNKERALSLYQNYLKIYGKKEKRAEIEGRIDELKRAIERDRAVATSPPTTTEPVGSGSGDPAGAPAAPPAPGSTGMAPSTSPSPSPSPPTAPPASTIPAASPPGADPGPPVLVAKPGEPADDRPLTRKPVFWVAVGGGVVAAVVIVLLLASGGSEDPSPTIGRAMGN